MTLDELLQERPEELKLDLAHAVRDQIKGPRGGLCTQPTNIPWTGYPCVRPRNHTGSCVWIGVITGRVFYRDPKAGLSVLPVKPYEQETHS